MNYELRPLTLAEILDAAFRLVQKEWRTLVGLSLLMQLPIVLLGSQASWLFDPFDSSLMAGEGPSPEKWMEIGLIAGAMFLAYLILYPLVAGAVTASVGNFYLGRTFSLAEATRAGGGALIKLVLCYLVYVLALSVGMFAMILIGGVLGASLGVWLGELGTAGAVIRFGGGLALLCVFLFWTFFTFAVSALLAPVVMLESKGVFASVARTFSLGLTSKGRVIGIVFTAGMIVGFPVFGAQMMVGWMPYLGILVWAAFQAIGFAFTTSVAVVLYFDLRCRAENYDLELLAEQVEAGPGLGQR